MATLIHKIYVYSDGTINVSYPFDLYRVNHDDGSLWRPNLPEVFRMNPLHHVVFNRTRQWLWRDMNPTLTIDQMTAMYGNTLAFTNGTGFPGHANYMTGQELDKEDPRFDQARLCGGALLKPKYISNGNLYFEYIDTRLPLPKVEEIMSKPWLYFEAVNIAWIRDYANYDIIKDGKKWRASIRPIKPLWGKRVFVPVIASREVHFPLSGLTKIPAGLPIPHPYTYKVTIIE